MDALGRMAAIILAVILLILFPIRYEAQKTDITMNSYLDTELDHFYHMICTRHEITRQMYADFNEQLSFAGGNYHIEIERYSDVIYNEESNRTYLDYEDLCLQLEVTDQIPLDQDDYILVRITKRGDTIIDRLENLFFPTLVPKSVYVTGGHME